jgi:hypothetical protein
LARVKNKALTTPQLFYIPLERRKFLKTIAAASAGFALPGLLAGLLLLVATPLHAHNSPSSSVMLDFYRDHVGAELTLPLAELELSFKQPLLTSPGAAFAKNETALKNYVAEHINPETADGKKWSVTVQGLKLQTNTQPFDLIAQITMTPPAEASARKFNFNYSVINHEVMSHCVFVSVRNDWDTAVFSGQPEPLGQIHFTVTSLAVDRSNGSWTRGFRSVFNLGLHHIAEGTDHLLFLLVLLLPAPLLAMKNRWGNFGGLKRAVWQLLKIVSAFTLGHSLTLLIGAAGWLRLPSQPVEILIAVSIFVSAIHALRPWFAGKEIFIAAGFGLIHGLAFADSIAGFGFSPWYLACTVLGFNLGIEAMQLVVVAVTIPWLILLARTAFYSPVRILGAVFGTVAALGLIGERALGWRNPFDAVVNSLAAHPLLLAGTLAGVALMATGWEWLKLRAPRRTEAMSCTASDTFSTQPPQPL